MKAFETPYLYFTLVSLTVVLVTFYFWTRRLKWMFGQLRRKWKIEPYDPRLLMYYKNAVWLWTFFFAIGCLMLTFAFYLTTYQYIGPKVEPAGQAIVSGSRVEYLGSDGIRIAASWKGNQVAAAGMFISFPRWMRYIGLENYHRMLTFRGNGEHDFHYGKVPEPSWIKPYVGPLLYICYKYREWMIPSLTYRESVYFGGGKHRVLITKDGYIVQ